MIIVYDCARIYKLFIELHISFCFSVLEADYTLDDSFWNEDAPIGK